MFFSNSEGLTNDVSNLRSQVELAKIGLEKFSKELLKSVGNVQTVIQAAGDINTQSAATVREVLGQTTLVGDQIQKAISYAAETTNFIGKTAKDNLELFAALNTSMQRNTFLTSQQIERFQALSVITNMTSNDIADMATSFDTLGYNTDQTLDLMKKMSDEARSYGVNVAGFMSDVNKNLKLMVTYNFKDGVEGLSRMVAKAQALRIDMSKTVSFADALLSPEKAIETAAGFQMLGGAVGGLSDPFKLLYMAQNDVDALQDSIVEMASSAVSFNKETGEFDISVAQMYRLREAANLAGMSYQELAEAGMNAAQRTEKLKILEGFSATDEQKELIASLGKIKEGSLQITMPSGIVRTITDGFSDLQKEDYETLENMLNVKDMTEKEIAENSLGYLKNIELAQNAMIRLTTLRLASDEKFTELLKSGSGVVDDIAKNFVEQSKNINLNPLFESFNKLIDIDGFEVSSEKIGDVMGKGVDAINSAIQEGADTFQNELGKIDWDNFFTQNPIKTKVTNVNADMVTLTSPTSVNADMVIPTPQTRPSSDGNVSLNIDGKVDLNLNGTQMTGIEQENLLAYIRTNPQIQTAIKNVVFDSQNNYS